MAADHGTARVGLFAAAEPGQGDPGQTLSQGRMGSGPVSPTCPGSRPAPAGTAEPGKAPVPAPLAGTMGSGEMRGGQGTGYGRPSKP